MRMMEGLVDMWGGGEDAGGETKTVGVEILLSEGEWCLPQAASK